MKLTEKQRKELEVWKHFIPTNCAWATENEGDKAKFFEWSERGLHKEEALVNTFLPEGRTYFHALVWGKKRAMIHVHELWAHGTQLMPWFEILEELPEHVREWVKKEAKLDDKTIFANTLGFFAFIRHLLPEQGRKE